MYHGSVFAENRLHTFKRCKTERKAKLHTESWATKRYRSLAPYGGKDIYIKRKSKRASEGEGEFRVDFLKKHVAPVYHRIEIDESALQTHSERCVTE